MTNPLLADRDRFADAHPERRIALNGREWGCLDIGAGPALILIPGTLGRADIFWRQIEALSDRLRVVAVTYPESGGVADWADDVVALMDRLEIDRAAILGSSLGGYLAQWMAGVHPARLSRLIGANTLHSAQGLNQRPPYSLDLAAAPIDDLRAGFGKGLEAWRAAHPEQSDLVDLLLAEVGGRIPEPELRRRLGALKEAEDLPPPGLASDAIVTIEADDDPLIPAEMRAAVRDRLKPRVAYRFLRGGHFPYIARPEAYTGLLEQVMEINGSGADWGAGAERSL